MKFVEDHADSHLVGLYLREIGQYPLLDAEQEIDLALKTQKGDSEARSQLILSNLRLVVNIAKRFQNQGLGLMDLIEEANRLKNSMSSENAASAPMPPGGFANSSTGPLVCKAALCVYPPTNVKTFTNPKKSSAPWRKNKAATLNLGN